jgi:hypothetical protein
LRSFGSKTKHPPRPVLAERLIDRATVRVVGRGQYRTIPRAIGPIPIGTADEPRRIIKLIRVGPEGRKLFEQFIRQVNILQAKQQLEAQAQMGVTERSAERGPG